MQNVCGHSVKISNCSLVKISSMWLDIKASGEKNQLTSYHEYVYDQTSNQFAFQRVREKYYMYITNGFGWQSDLRDNSLISLVKNKKHVWIISQ